MNGFVLERFQGSLNQTTSYSRMLFVWFFYKKFKETWVNEKNFEFAYSKESILLPMLLVKGHFINMSYFYIHPPQPVTHSRGNWWLLCEYIHQLRLPELSTTGWVAAGTEMYFSPFQRLGVGGQGACLVQFWWELWCLSYEDTNPLTRAPQSRPHPPLPPSNGPTHK